MNYEIILKWSEVWAVLIPLVIYFVRRPKQPYIKPVLWYLWIALFLNIIADVIREIYHTAPKFIVAINYNLPFYNIHSICRIFLFISFFNAVKIPATWRSKKAIPLTIGVIVLINFIFFDSIRNFSSKMFTLESIVLIVYCINYFLSILRSDEGSLKFNSSLVIATGLAVYESVCFPIFLFYDLLARQFTNYAISIWDFHNIMYVILCLFIARAFYGRIKI